MNHHQPAWCFPPVLLKYIWYNTSFQPTLFTCKQFYNVPPGQTQTLLCVTVWTFSVNLRFSSLLLFLLQIEACWRRSPQSIAQTSGKAGKVQIRAGHLNASLVRFQPGPPRRVQSPGHTETDLFINFCPFLSAFPEALTQESSCRSACQTPGGDVSSQSAGAAAALLRSWNTRVKHDMFLHCVIKMIYVCNFRKWWATDRKSETCWFESELIQMIDI